MAMSLGVTVNKDKNGLLLAYLATAMRDVRLRKLLKIVYLIDEHFMKLRGFPLTWFDYYAWARGPVAPEVYAVKDGAFSSYVSSRKDDDRRVVFSLKNDAEIAEGMRENFSPREAAEVERLVMLYRDKTADELSDLTHIADSLWSKVVETNKIQFELTDGKSDCEISLSSLFANGDRRLEAYHQALQNMAVAELFEAVQDPDASVHLRVITPSDRERYHNPAYKPVIP